MKTGCFEGIGITKQRHRQKRGEGLICALTSNMIVLDNLNRVVQAEQETRLSVCSCSTQLLLVVKETTPPAPAVPPLILFNLNLDLLVQGKKYTTKKEHEQGSVSVWAQTLTWRQRIK